MPRSLVTYNTTMPTNTNTPSPLKKNSTNALMDSIKDFFSDLVDLREGMDREGTLENIHNNKRMRGANAWLLMCSIMVASLGLDLNSPAVIIGAMLISPLMSPILGIGLGIGINDKRTLKISIQHFAIAIAIALTTSFLYFKMTPFGNITHEILSRTEPTLLDGFVAIFGGLAGVISITRKDKSNAVPGVAIATALMPPLCVAGFGLANGKWNFFQNAFYLFFLNSFFIAITTYLIIRILGFPYKKYMNVRERNRGRLYILLFSAIILLPAILILVRTVNKVQDNQIIEEFLAAKIQDEATIISDWKPIVKQEPSIWDWVLKSKEERNQDTTQLVLKIIGDPVSQEELKIFDAELEMQLDKPIEFITYQSEEIPLEDIQRLQKQVQGEIANRLHALEQLQAEKTVQLEDTQAKLDSMQQVELVNVYAETKAAFPRIREIGIATEFTKTNFSKTEEIPVVILKWSADKSSSTRKRDEPKLEAYIKTRLKLDSLQLVTY